MYLYIGFRALENLDFVSMYASSGNKCLVLFALTNTRPNTTESDLSTTGIQFLHQQHSQSTVLRIKITNHNPSFKRGREERVFAKSHSKVWCVQSIELLHHRVLDSVTALSLPSLNAIQVLRVREKRSSSIGILFGFLVMYSMKTIHDSFS
jgi:hypothetical protein